jgi:hypothetical protein
LFERDTFAFANELYWEYRLEPDTNRVAISWNQPPPTYAHRCFVMVRSARQFFYHARFEEQRPRPDEASYRRLVREVVSRSPRHPSAELDKVVIPGYPSLRKFSQEQGPLLKAACGGAWQSYFLRSHWRMILPILRCQQERLVGRLPQSFRDRTVPILHLVRFPQLTINHGVVLFDSTETQQEVRYQVYDPNQPGGPAELVYHRSRRTFFFPRNHYWAGGRVDVIEVYRGWLY